MSGRQLFSHDRLQRAIVLHKPRKTGVLCQPPRLFFSKELRALAWSNGGRLAPASMQRTVDSDLFFPPSPGATWANCVRTATPRCASWAPVRSGLTCDMTERTRHNCGWPRREKTSANPALKCLPIAFHLRNASPPRPTPRAGNERGRQVGGRSCVEYKRSPG